jgi:hypothetical protein
MQRQESFATGSFLVSQLRYFCGRSAAVRRDQLGAQSGRLGVTNVALGWARREHPGRR